MDFGEEVQTCHLRLLDHINKAESIIGELERHLDDAASMVQTTEEQDEDVKTSVDSFTVFNTTGEVLSSDLTKPNVTDFASMMAIIYSMVKQDYTMQDRIASSLSIVVGSGTGNLLPDAVIATLYRR
ncbi:uncharacterized protein [Primulina huaijiensis]|uniref:uncharacterized protein isoform X2 n=1 Tax=Primulina huaijiensis TaxID=1492673 RepID=UPI003CC6F97F